LFRFSATECYEHDLSQGVEKPFTGRKRGVNAKIAILHVLFLRPGKFEGE